MHKYGGDQGALSCVGGETKKKLHYEDQNSLPHDSEKRCRDITWVWRSFYLKYWISFQDKSYLGN